MLGAPRILQAVSADGITPRWLARGYGKTHEPRNALLVAFAIGEAGILIAELNVIARVVSIVFMTMYGFLNTACAIESLVSPDFRPDFRIPKTVSVVGAVMCVLLMISMDLVAMAGATVLMAALYVYLQRRQLQLDSGDAWEGVWSAVVRAGLHRLARASRQHRNWQPNILLFRPDDGEPRLALRRMAASLITGNGMLTDVLVRPPGKAKRGAEGALEAGPVVGVFERTLAAEDPYAAIATFCRHHGYTGIEPNTVLLDWETHAEGSARFAELVDDLRGHDLNTLLFSDATHEPPEGTPLRIDVWWREDGSPALAISLIRFITASLEYRSAKIRFLTVSSDASVNDALRNATRRMLEAARVSAEVEVLLDAVDPRPFEAWVADRSKDAKLAIVELPKPPLAQSVEALDEVRAAVPRALFVAGNSGFGAVARLVRPGPVARPARRRDEDEELAPIDLPETPELAREAEAFGARVEGRSSSSSTRAWTRRPRTTSRSSCARRRWPIATSASCRAGSRRATPSSSGGPSTAYRAPS
ncbi:MAG: hypothetical protein M5U28_51915 [Sandaracinaceae bacterium]|nr:hypothetical protein [Sandaracinaceae bacterium]